MIDVLLTDDELRHAGYVGVDRRIRAIDLGDRSDPERQRREHVLDALLGAWGEVAMAKAADRYWCDVGGPDHGAPDVGEFHVRTVDHLRKRLIIHPSDDDGGVFVLVTQLDVRRYRISGWLLGREAKRPEWWIDPVGGRPAYFVPRHELRSMDLLLTTRKRDTRHDRFIAR